MQEFGKGHVMLLGDGERAVAGFDLIDAIILIGWGVVSITGKPQNLSDMQLGSFEVIDLLDSFRGGAVSFGNILSIITKYPALPF